MARRVISANAARISSRPAVRLERQGAAEDPHGLGIVVRPDRKQLGQGRQMQIVGGHAARPLAAGAFDLGLPDVGLDDRHHAFGDAILNVEDILDRAFEILAP